MSENASSAAAPLTEPPKPRVRLFPLLFGMRERVSQRAYLTAGFVLMAVKYAADAGLAYAVTGKFFSPLDYVNPVYALRSKALAGGPDVATPEGVLLAMAVFTLPFLWIGVSMTMRRAVDAGKSPWLALLFFVPGFNYLTMIALAILPSKEGSHWPLPEPPPVVDQTLTSALFGVAAGLGIAGAMSALSIYALGSYGAGLFLGTPLLMGASSAFLFNRGHPRTLSSTIVVAILTVAIAGACLLLFALEGVFCLIMALPIAGALGILGAIIGRAIALGTSSPSSGALAAVVMLPLLAGAEVELDAPLERPVTTTREINAPPEVVWQHVVTFTELKPPAEWFFNAGIAYPLRARIDGTGVGAVRHCEFSTGPFVEPITVWDEPRELAFDVTAQPMPMQEWSPYRVVNAPHLERSLKSRHGRFLLTPLDGGKRTQLEGTTWYTLDMAPAIYWRLWTEWLLHSIHTRVLDHIADLSEADHPDMITLGLALALSVVGADADADAADAKDAGAAVVDGLAAVKERGELLWGADAQGGAPYIFQDPRDPNHIVGFEVDIADAVAAKLGVKARPMQGQWEKLLELLERGDFDVAINGIEVNEEKLRVCELTNAYYVAAERLTVRKDDAKAPHDLASAKGRPMGTLPSSTAERILARADADVHTYDGGQDDIYKDLLLKRTDGVLLDEPITKYYGAIEPALRVVDGAFGEVRYAAAVKKGDTTLKRAIDDALASLAADGSLKKIYLRWGLWNEETATLFHDPDAASATSTAASTVAEGWEAWRAAVGKRPPFWERVRTQYPSMIGLFAKGAGITLAVCVLAMLLAVTLGVLLAVTRSFAPAPLRWLATAYVEIFRGTPLLVQLTMIYFGLPELGLTLSPFAAGVLALGLNYAAAESENYRAGLLSVPSTQLDAARVLGLSTPQALRFVVLPQAVRVSLPPMTNDFIALLKDSSLISIVTLTELTKTYSILANSTRDHLGLGVVVACWYLVVGLPFVFLSRRLEARLGKHARRAGGA